MKIFNIICKILLTLLLATPILGTLGIFPEPTRAMYQTDEAYNFIMILMHSGYVMWMMSVVFIASLILLWKNKTAVVALLLLPITRNIVGFHAFLDGGLLTGGAVMGNVLLLINVYYLWVNRRVYRVLV